MNILVVCHYGLYQNLSYSFVHAQAKAYVAVGHRVRVLIPVPLGKRDWNGSCFAAKLWQADGVELLPLRFLSFSNYGEKHFNTSSAIVALNAELARLLDGFRPDVIHAHTLGFDSEIGAWLKKKTKCPLVVTVHGSDISIPVEQGKSAELRPFCDRADCIVAVSSTLANKLCTCGTQTPISVILNGFDVHALPVSRDKTQYSFVQVGHLLRQKRFDVSLRAFAAVRKTCPDATFTVVGQGEERVLLEKLCYELGIQDAVRFTGQIPNSLVLEEMADARFFIMPSVREGFGIVYLEAMASGCIIIGTQGEGIADLVVSGQNGFLVPPDDVDAILQVIEWCLAHPTEADNIAEYGRQEALSLTWETNAKQYITLFKEFVRDGTSHTT